MIIDEDPAFRRKASRFLTERSFTVHDAEGADSGLAAVLRHRPQFVLVDVNMKVAPGVDLIETIAQSPEAPRVVGVASSPKLPEVVAAVKAGAMDVLERPVDGERLVAIIQEAAAVGDALANRGRRPTPVGLPAPLEVDVLVSESAAMKSVLQAVSRLAPSEQVLVLVAPPGSRPDAIARYFHRVGPRAEGPFVTVGSQGADERLFGSAQRASAFAEAKGGIVYIESLAALGASGQERLAKLIQGLSTSHGPGPVRWPPMVIGCERPLGVEVREQRLRPDVARMLDRKAIEIPALAARRDDIPILIHRVVSAIETQLHPRTVRVDPRVVEALVGREWSGGIDELVTSVRNSACMNEDRELFLDLTARPEVVLPRVEPVMETLRVEAPEPEEPSGWQPQLDDDGNVQPYDVYEAEIFRFALHNAGGCVSRAAELLGVGRATMYRKMRAYDIDVPPVSERAISRSRRSPRREATQ